MLTRTALSHMLTRLFPLLRAQATRLPAPWPAYVLFFSLCDGDTRAHVLTVSGQDLDDVWQRGAEQARRHLAASGMALRWLRVDWVDQAETSHWGALGKALEQVKRNYFRHGLSLDPAFRHAFLEGEVNGNALLYGGPTIAHCVVNAKNLRRYAQIRHGLATIDLADAAPVTLFSTQGLFTTPDSDEVQSLAPAGPDAGRRVIDSLTAQDVRHLVEEGSRYLGRQVGPDGRFRYGWHPCFDREIDTYNSLRHASSLYALIEAWEETRDPAVKLAIDRSLTYLTDTLIDRMTLPDGRAAAFLIDQKQEIKLGGNAVCLLALVKYSEVTGTQDHLPLMEALGTGILHMQDASTGAFVHVLHHPSLAVKQAFRIIYYDGEAAFGLMRLYGLTRDPRWLAAVERAFTWFIAQDHWKAHDHWLGYCVNELTLYRPERVYFEFGVRNVSDHLDFVIERITTFPTLLEMMMAAERMIARLHDHPDRDTLLAGLDLPKFYHALHRRAHHMLNGHMWPEIAMYFQAPNHVQGGFFIRHHGFRVRIDDVEHYLSGYVAYGRYLAGPRARLDTPWTPPVPVAAPAAVPRPAKRPDPAPGWSAKDVATATGGIWIVPPSSGNWRATGLTIWSPSMRPGHMVTVHSDKAAGVLPTHLHLLPYMPQALLTDRQDLAAPVGVPVLHVADVNAAVLAMGRFIRPRLRGKVIGITGSAGKTTMVAMLAHVLRPWGEVGQTRHNANLPHGVAWNLASMPVDAPFTVLEMAVGRMRISAQIARPDIAIVTNITAAHLKYHGTMEEVARRKARMFEGMAPGAVAILNRDMAHWDIFAQAATDRGLRICYYGQHEDAAVRLMDYDPATWRAQVTLAGRTHAVALGAPGLHMALNACACIAAIDAAGMDVDVALPMFRLFRAMDGRGAISDVQLGDRTLRLVDEAYNANPASMEAAIGLIRAVEPPVAGGRRVLVLGDMLELGPDSRALHAALAPAIVSAAPDLLLLCGPDMAALEAALPPQLQRRWLPDADALIARADNWIDDGDLILVKSSGGTGLSALVRAIRQGDLPIAP